MKLAQEILGQNNSNLSESTGQVIRRGTFRDLSTVWVTPSAKGMLDMQVVFSSWMAMAKPLNQKIITLGIANAEVADAYNAAVEMILRDSFPWKYMLTVEHDNLPPVDGLLKLYESIQNYDAVGGLYWMKGMDPTPMIYGNPDTPGDFRPQAPVTDSIQPCNGLGMGFTLFDTAMFRMMKGPWFKTVDELQGTQDLYFFREAAKLGYKFACDTRVKVGHIDFETRKIY